MKNNKKKVSLWENNLISQEVLQPLINSLDSLPFFFFSVFFFLVLIAPRDMGVLRPGQIQAAVAT